MDSEEDESPKIHIEVVVENLAENKSSHSLMSLLGASESETSEQFQPDSIKNKDKYELTSL